MANDAALIRLPRRDRSPLAGLGKRVLLGLGLILFVALVAYADRDGYKDAAGGTIDLLDCFYYATVSITTTGYGDIIPVTDRSRLITTILITPARILFLVLLVSTTVEVLAESSRRAFRERIWRRKLRDHTIVCGYGTKGRSAVATLLARGGKADEIVVLDPREHAVAEANRDGLAALQSDAATGRALEEAGVRDAKAVIVATDRDDTSVLITLTVREHNAHANVIAAAREDENRHLLHQSGATSVITSSSAAGRLLGLASQSPELVEVLEDLLTVGSGLDLEERSVPPEAVGGPLSALPAKAPVIAVVRDGETMRFDDERTRSLKADDLLVCLCSNPGRPHDGQAGGSSPGSTMPTS